MTEPISLVLLHGAGQGPTDWDAVIAALPDHLTAHALDLGLDQTFTLSNATQEVVDFLGDLPDRPVVLCGLSLGARIAASVAALGSQRVHRLVLSGVPVRPNPTLMRLQLGVLRVIPARVLDRAGGPPKADLLHVLSDVRNVDAADILPEISIPTLVLCGSKDRPNLGGARTAAELLPDGELRVVEGVGHQWNLTHPALFAQTLSEFCSPGR